MNRRFSLTSPADASNGLNVYAHGFTMLELLVSISVIAILIAISVPAVQRGRETARNVQCKSHLHQIGIATEQFVDRSGEFPRKPPLTRMLSELGYPALAAALADGKANVEFVALTLVCPSDAWSEAKFGHLNYLMNDGALLISRNGVHDYGNDVHGIRPSEVTDGLSQTALFSERLMPHRGTGENAPYPKDDPIRGIWFIRGEFGRDGEEEAFTNHCVDPSNRETMVGWVVDIRGVNGNAIPYKHVLPPNAYSCFTAHRPNGPGDTPAYQILSANSQHAGGVNLLLCDGSCRFVSNEINIMTWRALGSRDGAESLSDF